MRLPFLLLTLSFLVSPSLGLAQGALADLCEALQNQRAEFLEDRAKLPNVHFWDLLGFAFNRGSAIGLVKSEKGALLKVADPPSPGELRVKTPLVIVAPPRQPKSNVESEFRKLHDRLSQESQKVLVPLLEANGLEACLAVASSQGLTDGWAAPVIRDFETLESLRSQVSRKLGYEMAQKARQAAWFDTYVVETESYREIPYGITRGKRELRAERVDVALMLHGSREGPLSDMSDHMIPPGFFFELAENRSIRSLILYCCYADSVSRYLRDALHALSEAGISVYFAKNRGILEGTQAVGLSLFPNLVETFLRLDSQPGSEK